MTTAARPLDGVRVVDLTRLLPGAYATSLLVGMGADVVKVEDPRGGDGLRVTPPFTPSGESGLFLALCRGKRSVALDLKNPVARDALLAIVATAHVVIDSFRPAVLDRLGLGPGALAAANPSLVHVSMTAYGDGERAALPGHDLNVEGYAGILGLTRGADGSASMPPFPVADMASGLQAALAVVAGLRAAEAGARGAAGGPAFRADVTMLDSAVSLTAIGQGAVMATGEAPPVPDLLTGALACYGIYRCADGAELAVGALEPTFFARVAELVGDPGLAAVQYDGAGQDALRGRLTLLFASRPRADWLALLEHDQTCVTPVRTSAEALADPDLRARGVLEDVLLVDGGTTTAARPVAWLPADGAALGAPALGQDTDAVLRAVGVDPASLG
ncbi:MAG: CaiB/BaiF CoA transferase family protein [Candidatus Nanopelagicales bacterium]